MQPIAKCSMVCVWSQTKALQHWPESLRCYLECVPGIQVGPRNHVEGGGPDPPRERGIWGHLPVHCDV